MGPEVTFLGLREHAIRWDQDKEGNWNGAANQVTAQPTADTAGQQQTQAAIHSLMEQVTRLASLVASGQSQAPSAASAPKQPAAEMAALQQALAEAMAAIQSLTEQVARLQSLVEGQKQAPRAAPVKAPKQSILCFRCGGKGHVVRLCPKKQRNTKTQQQVAEMKAVGSRRVQEEKKGIVSRVTGTVKWFNVKREMVPCRRCIPIEGDSTVPAISGRWCHAIDVCLRPLAGDRAVP